MIRMGIFLLRFLPASTVSFSRTAISLGRYTVTPTLIAPTISIVLLMVHHLQDEKLARTVPHAANQPEPVIAHVKHDAVPHLISRPKDLFHFREVRPIGVLREFVPSRKIPFRNFGVVRPGFPKLTQGAF